MNGKIFLGFVSLLGIARANPTKVQKLEVTQITLVVQRHRDGKKYPNDVKETYVLGADRKLSYRAYFSGVPSEFDPVDGVEWKGDETARHLLETAARLARGSLLTDLPDDAPQPDPEEAAFVVTVNTSDGDSSRIARDHKSRGWSELDAAFRAMLTHFEASTHRPRKSGRP